MLEYAWRFFIWLLYALGTLFTLLVIFLVRRALVLRKRSKWPSVPPLHGTLQLSAVQLAEGIRDGTLKSVQVCELYIERIRVVNPRLNAMVAFRFEEALKEANAADEQVAAWRAARSAGKSHAALPPFLGVPCSVKECFAVRDMPNTSGLVSRVTKRAPHADATVVARLRAAGFIPLGVTNVSELCMWYETSNYVYGRTNNAYHPDFMCGGSSGGEASIIAAAGAPVGIGSDIGGSIRMPAFFNGVFGHKPTGGLVPNTGQFPCAENAALRYLCTGPITRRAADLWPMLSLMAGPDGEDYECGAWQLGDPATVSFSGRRVVLIRSLGNSRLVSRVSPDLRQAMQNTAEAFRAMGAIVEEHNLPPMFNQVFDVWSACLASAGGTTFGQHLLGADAGFLTAFRELIKYFLFLSPHTFPAIGLALLEPVAKLFTARTARFLAVREEMKKHILGLLRNDAILVMPTFPTAAQRHHRALLRIADFSYTALFNILELPVTQVPMGFLTQSRISGASLPVGVQVAAAHGNDHLTVAAAIELERRFGSVSPSYSDYRRL